VNRIKILKDGVSNQIQIPLFEEWDYNNREDSVNEYSQVVLKELIGSGTDYEITRFSKRPIYDNSTNSYRTSVKHVFKFFNPDTNTWDENYINPNYFSFNDIKNNDKAFKNSFFKLDLYDKMEQSKRKNFLTVVLQNNQDTFNYDYNGKIYVLKKPSYSLNYNTTSEGFFIYWFKNKEILNLDSLFMTAKFFNSNTGEFVTFLNESDNTKKVIDSKFYYKVNFNFNNYTYYYSNTTINTEIETITWYEYLNPTS
jgi:hypothetical protein